MEQLMLFDEKESLLQVNEEHYPYYHMAQMKAAYPHIYQAWQKVSYLKMEAHMNKVVASQKPRKKPLSQKDFWEGVWAEGHSPSQIREQRRQLASTLVTKYPTKRSTE